jgi:tRNA pseudouridine55 synthase
MNGLVLIDKPSGCTSHDVVNRWRRLSGTKRAGHLGTLDPMATGLLLIVTGVATRLARFFTAERKTYLAAITFGQYSDTYDAEGQVTSTGIAPPSDPVVLNAALARFTGHFLQVPPPVSAKKIGGVPAYKLARQNRPVDLAPVEVVVSRLELLSSAFSTIDILVSCSAGTYIRSIAHDLGRALGCGALLSRLRRIESGGFNVADAHSLDSLASLQTEGKLAQAVLPPAQLFPQWPAEHFSPLVEMRIRQGRDFRTSPFVVPANAPFVKALSHSGELIAIGQLKIPNFYHPEVVL